jgi:hypothetical protein
MLQFVTSNAGVFAMRTIFSPQRPSLVHTRIISNCKAVIDAKRRVRDSRIICLQAYF